MQPSYQPTTTFLRTSKSTYSPKSLWLILPLVGVILGCMILNCFGWGTCSKRKRERPRRKVYNDTEMMRGMPTLTGKNLDVQLSLEECVDVKESKHPSLGELIYSKEPKVSRPLTVVSHFGPYEVWLYWQKYLMIEGKVGQPSFEHQGGDKKKSISKISWQISLSSHCAMLWFECIINVFKAGAKSKQLLPTLISVA